LENKICAIFKDDCVTREGKSYFSTDGVYKGREELRPLYLRAVGPLYVKVFPVALTIFVIFGVLRCGVRPCNVTFWLDLVFGSAIIFYNIIYLRWVCCKK
jgi:hypothetical protein